MPVIGIREVLIKPVFTGSQQSIARELDGIADASGDKAGRSAGARMGAALGGALKVGALAAGTAAVGGIALALTKGFGRLQAIENATAKLTGLGHSAEVVKGIMADATASVKGTAFGLDEAATVAAGAVAAGVKPGKELERTLKLTGDAATIAGVGMGEMGAIFNKVSSSNKIQGDVIAQLNDAGIPIIQLLGKELGKTAEETVALASEGKINFETFQKAMEQGLGGAALKSGETLQGAFKNTMAAVGRIGASLLSGVYPKIREFFAGAIEWMKPLEEGAKVAGAAIGTFLESALTGAQGLYDLVVKGDFTGKMTSAFGWEEDSPFVDFLLRARDGALGLYDLIIKGDYTGMLYRAFGWEEDSRFVDFLLTVRDTVLKIPDALAQVIDAGKNVAKFLWDMREPIGIIAGLIVLVLIPHWVALGVEAIKSAIQQKIAWGMARGSAIGAAFTHSWAVTVMVGGWVLMAAQATVNALKIAAGWVIAMGPVGWVIGIIALLVGAFVLAYNNIGWFRDGVDAAMRWVGDAVANTFQWIQDAIGSVVGWFTGTLAPAWNGAIQSVGGFFNWLWTDVIKPVFDGIGTVVRWVYESVIKPVFDGISAAVKFVGDVFTAFYNAVLKPVFDSAAVIIGGFYLFFRGMGQLFASVFVNIILPILQVFWNNAVNTFTAIGAAISGWWTFVSTVFGLVVGYVQNVLAGVFNWFRDTISMVFQMIGAAASNWWSGLQANFQAVVGFVQSVLAAVFTWLYNSIIKPVFDGIGVAASWMWNSVLKPIFDGWVYLFRNILGPAFVWLYENAVKPSFDNIGNGIKWVWETIIRPVFDALSNFITKTIPDAFNQGVGFIKTAWDKLIEIAKMPVKFVIDTVINDGLIGAFNTVAGILPGIDKLPRVALPAGFSEGGYTGPGGKFQPAGIVHAGEVVWSQADIARWGGVGVVEAMRKAVGYAKGGLVHPLRASQVSQPFSGSHNGMDFAAPTGTPVVAAGPGRVSSAGWSSYGGGNEIHVDHPNGLQTWYAHLSSFAVRMGEMVRAGQTIGQVGSTGNSTGPHLHYMVMNGGWPNYVNPAAYLDGGGESGSGGGWNPLGGIVDGLIDQFKRAFPAAGFMADIAIGVGKKLFGSVIGAITGKGGTDSGLGTTGGPVPPPYLYDNGGVLNPGLTSILNATRKPEAIYTHEQNRALQALAERGARHDGSRGGVNFNGPIHVRNEQELARVMRTSELDAQALYPIS